MAIETAEPKLQAPGAGLPWYQMLLLRLYVGPFVAGKSKWEDSERSFEKLTEKIMKEIEGLNDLQLSTKILVPPQVGLEDSSRYWSIAMALEHLVIVGKAISFGVSEMTSGRLPDYKVDTAKVKPLGIQAPKDSVSEFEKFCFEDYGKLILSLKNRDSDLKLKHPWFGPFTAKQWFWLLGVHHGVHLKQIREIKKRLPLL